VKFLQLRENLVTGLVGMIFVGSAAIGRQSGPSPPLERDSVFDAPGGPSQMSRSGRFDPCATTSRRQLFSG
jgi:hypothetical protein